MIRYFIRRLPITMMRLRYVHYGMRRMTVGLGDGRLLTKTIFGHKLFLDARDQSLTPHIAIDGAWELGMTRHILRRARRGMHVAEVGANIGYYTTLMARAVGSEGTVEAFEANPSVFSMLRDNVNLNGFRERCRLHAAAASDAQGSVTFHVLDKLHGSGNLAGFKKEILDEFGDSSRPITVPAMTFDGAFEGRKIHLIRMDAEGSEPRVLNGAKRVVESQRPTIVTEFSPVMIRGSGMDPGEFLDRMAANRYRIRLIDDIGGLRDVSRDYLLSLDLCDIDMEPF